MGEAEYPPVVHAEPAPPAGGFGQLPIAPLPFGPMMHRHGDGGGSARPIVRGPYATGIAPLAVYFLGSFALNIVMAVIGLYQIAVLAQVLQLACIVWFACNAMRGLGDLRRATNNPGFVRWPTLVPVFGTVYWLTAVVAEVQKAKAMHGLTPNTRSLFTYLFFPVFALQRDLNDISTGTNA